MEPRQALIVVCTAASSMWSCAPPEDDPGLIEFGQIAGDIEFENPPGAVASFIASQTLSYPSDPRVIATSVADVELSSMGLYSPPNGGGASASYALSVPLGTPGSSTFRLEVDTLEFEPNPASPIDWIPIGENGGVLGEEVPQLGGPQYRFGSAEPGATGALLATLVDGSAEFDISECAALVNVRVRLTGTEGDLDALDGSPGSIICTVQARAEDVAASQVYLPQASSDLVVTDLGVIREEGVVVPLLVRGNGTRMKLLVVCAAHTIGSGFPLPPELPEDWTSMEYLSSALVVNPVGCNEVVEIEVNVPVERTAGSVRGLFDIVGADESSQGLGIASEAGYLLTPPTAPASATLDDGDPADYWEFEGVPAGNEVVVHAWAVLDGGESTVETPHTAPLNVHVDVQAGQTTDLAAQFVADPHVLTGTLELLDPSPAEMDLRLLRNDPFDSMSRYLHSHIQARGNSGKSMEPNGASGVSARARGLLTGAFDEETRVATLGYTLPLIGLGPVDGALNGSDAFPTPWDVDRILLYLRGASVQDPTQTLFQRIDIEPGYSLNYDAQPGEADTVPTMTMCFGHACLELRVAPGGGSFYEPRMVILESPVSVSTQVQPTAYTKVTYGEVRGYPSESDQAATLGQVHAVLPEGIQYTVRPSVRFLSNEGQESEMTLQELMLPFDGPVECGEVTCDCVSVDEEGNLYTLGIALDPSVPCDSDTVLTLAVQSDLQVSLIELELFDGETGSWGATQTVCAGPCGVSPAFDVGVDLSGGIERVRVRVQDEFGCVAEREAIVQSSTPLIDCPPQIVVEIGPDESTISSVDPRIQPPLDSIGAFANCGNLPSVDHDAPSEFGLGATSVTFTAEGAEPCSTEVIVQVDPTAVALLAVTIAGPLVMDIETEQEMEDWSLQNFVFGVHNLGSVAAQHVVFQVHGPTGKDLLILSADRPEAEITSSSLVPDGLDWDIGTLPPGSSESVVVSAAAGDEPSLVEIRAIVTAGGGLSDEETHVLEIVGVVDTDVAISANPPTSTVSQTSNEFEVYQSSNPYVDPGPVQVEVEFSGTWAPNSDVPRLGTPDRHPAYPIPLGGNRWICTITLANIEGPAPNESRLPQSAVLSVPSGITVEDLVGRVIAPYAVDPDLSNNQDSPPD